MYMIHTRPDRFYALIAMIHLITESRQRHWVETKHNLRYLRGTITYGLRYTSSGGLFLHGYVDDDWERSTVDQKSTSRYCFSLGSTMISWPSRKQGSIAHITIEVEYIAISDASKEAVWLIKLVSGLFGENLETTVVHCDNQSCIKLTENPVFHDMSKHIDMRYDYIRDLVQRKAIKLQYIATSEQVVDILTKPLTLRQFVKLRGKLDVANNDSLPEREC
jgi:hypothetical protein